MKGRIAVSVVLAIGVALATAGCGLIVPQSTTRHYVASDGSDGSTGSIAVRNAILVSGNNGKDANLVVTLVNSAASERLVKVQRGTGSAAVEKTIAVPAYATKKVGETAATGVLFRDLGAKPGSLEPLYFQYGSVSGTRILVPVLTGGLYPKQVPTESELAPKPTPRPTVTILPVPLESATPTPTPTPAG